MSYKYKLGFIGAGNMALAIACGVTKAGLYNGSELIASDIASERRDLFVEKLKTTAVDNNRQVIQEAQTTILAIKPQQAQPVLYRLLFSYRQTFFLWRRKYLCMFQHVHDKPDLSLGCAVRVHITHK